MEYIEKHYHQRISDTAFPTHEVPYGLLARAALASRKELIFNDLLIGNAAEEELKGGQFERALQCMAITFSKQIIEISPEEIAVEGAALRRFQFSCMMATQILNTHFSKVHAALKAI